MARYVPTSSEPVEYDDSHIASSKTDLFRGTNLTNLFNEKKASLLSSFSSFETNGSGWVLDKNLKFIVRIYRYTPLQNANEGAQPSLNINEDDVGGGYFDIGDYFRNKKAIIVPQNKDEYCGLWAFCIAKFKPEKDAGKITKRLREQSKKVDITGVGFPMGKRDMIRLLRNNNTRAHVLCAEVGSQRIDHYIVDRNPEIILLFIKNQEGQAHWCVIPSLSSLSRLTSSGISKSKRARFICPNCHINTFRTPTKLKSHQERCFKNEAQLLETVPENTFLEFKDFHKIVKCPIKIVADFECYQPECGELKGKNSEYVCDHIPSGYGICVMSNHEEVYKTHYECNTFNGDVAKDFIKKLIEIRDKIDAIPSKDMIFTEQDGIAYEGSSTCWICKGPFSGKEDGRTKGNLKVRDHCHWTGRFRGAAHSKCNLRLREQIFIPVIFHNLKGYDSHLFIRAFHDLEEEPNCIPQNTEKFISFSLKKTGCSELSFLDSLAFMNGKLSDLASYLKEYPVLSKFCSPEEVRILSRKGVFPYEWFNRFDKLFRTDFPEHKAFFSKLANENISKKDYEFGKSVYERFCRTMMDYHELYLKTDVLLLGDVVQEFCNTCHEKTGLEPFQYYTSPGFFFDSALKKSGVRLELLSDPDMYLFFEQGIRRGYSNVHKNYQKANHKYLGKYYNPEEEKIYLWYVDMNSLYPTVMVDKMPVRDFRWAKQNELNDILEFCKTGQYDKIPPCTLSVNLKHDPKNFSKEKKFTMCPTVYDEDGVKKLAHTLFEKNDYVIHYRTLIKNLEEGMDYNWGK